MVKTLTVIAALLILAAGASGAIIDPGSISAVASSSWWQGPAAVTASYDGTGMVSATEHEGIDYGEGTYSSMWLLGGNPRSTPPNGIHGGVECMGYAQYSFDASYALDDLNIFNIGGTAYGLSARDVHIQYSNVVSPTVNGDWSDIFSGTLVQGPEGAGGTSAHGVTDVLDAGDVNARHVAISILNSYYNYPPGMVYGGISEVQFVLVPEPVTVVVLALGAGLALLRKRR